MTVFWINTESDNALALMEAVAHVLEQGDAGAPPPPGIANAPARPIDPGDAYLADNLAAARATWSVDPHRIVVSNRPGLAAAINAFQRLTRRATWWYALPQWLQISEFHGALLRALEALAEKERLLGIRVREVEQLRLPAHLFALQQQVATLRGERDRLEQRIAELEARLVALEERDTAR